MLPERPRFRSLYSVDLFFSVVRTASDPPPIRAFHLYPSSSFGYSSGSQAFSVDRHLLPPSLTSIRAYYVLFSLGPKEVAKPRFFCWSWLFSNTFTPDL